MCRYISKELVVKSLRLGYCSDPTNRCCNTLRHISPSDFWVSKSASSSSYNTRSLSRWPWPQTHIPLIKATVCSAPPSLILSISHFSQNWNKCGRCSADSVQSLSTCSSSMMDLISWSKLQTPFESAFGSTAFTAFTAFTGPAQSLLCDQPNVGWPPGIPNTKQSLGWSDDCDDLLESFRYFWIVRAPASGGIRRHPAASGGIRAPRGLSPPHLRCDAAAQHLGFHLVATWAFETKR